MKFPRGFRGEYGLAGWLRCMRCGSFWRRKPGWWKLCRKCHGDVWQ